MSALSPPPKYFLLICLNIAIPFAPVRAQGKNELLTMQILLGSKVISQHEIHGNARNNSLNQSQPSIQDQYDGVILVWREACHNMVIDRNGYAACFHNYGVLV